MDGNRGNRMSRFGPQNNCNNGPQNNYNNEPQNNYNNRPPNSNQMQMPIQYPSRQMMQQKPPSGAQLTTEQIAFETDFKKWEQSFTDWQKAYANHHDRVAYKQYEQKFLDVREKLLIKRTQIYSRSNVERQLASELEAAAALADSILQKFSEPSMPPVQPNYDNCRGGGEGNFDYRRGGGDNNFGNRRGDGDNDFGNRHGGLNNRFDDRFSGPPPMMMNRNDKNCGGVGGRPDRSRSPYFNHDPPVRSQECSQDMRSRNQYSRSPPRKDRRNQSGRNNDRQQNDRGMGGRIFGGNDRNRRDGNNHNSNSRVSQNRQQPQDDTRRAKKLESLNVRELTRKDVYPNIPWLDMASGEKPPLVGKRRKKMRAKILKLLDMRKKLAKGEIPKVDDKPKDRISLLLEAAKKVECPNRLPGAARRRFVHLNAKNFSEWSDRDRKFMEYAEYTRVTRAIYYKKQKDKEIMESTVVIPMKTTESST